MSDYEPAADDRLLRPDDADDDSVHSSSGPAQPRLFSTVFIAIVGVALFCFISGQGLNAGTSVYINRVGGSATLAGVSAAVFSGAAIVGRLVSGPLADMRGRLVVMVSGGIILLVGMLGAALTGGLDLIMIWRTLQGLGFSAVTTAAATAAADVLPIERLGEGIGYYGLGQALAMSIGPALAIALVATDPPENLFFGFTVAAALVLVCCAFCRYESHPEILPETATYRSRAASKRAHAESGEGSRQRPGILASIIEPKALAGGIPFMVLSPAYGFGIFFVGLLGAELGVGNAGLFYTVSAISMIVIRLSSKAFMDRVLPLKLFGVAVAAGVVCYSMLLVTSLPLLEGGARDALFYAAGLFYGLSLGMGLPVNQTVAVKNSPADRWGAANGLFLLLMDAGIGTATVIWGITNDAFGFSFTLVCVIICVAASFGVACIAYPPFAKRRQ